MTQVQIIPERITNAGLIGRIIKETPARTTVEITDLFFPVHETRYGTYQIGKNEQKYLRDLMTGQIRTFWKTGTRANFEVGHTHKIVDWDYAA